MSLEESADKYVQYGQYVHMDNMYNMYNMDNPGGFSRLNLPSC